MVKALTQAARSGIIRAKVLKDIEAVFLFKLFLDINIASLILVYNLFTMGYHDNKQHKHIIDCVLEQNAKLFMNLGVDCSRSEYEKAKVKERQKLRRIIDLDPEKIGRLIKDSLDD